MKNIIWVVVSSLFLISCGSQESGHRSSELGFQLGSDRESILKQLGQIDATILKDSLEFVHAEFRPAELKNPLQVELSFADGKLMNVNFLPQ